MLLVVDRVDSTRTVLAAAGPWGRAWLVALSLPLTMWSEAADFAAM
jgi:hypothetical protein